MNSGNENSNLVLLNYLLSCLVRFCICFCLWFLFTFFLFVLCYVHLVLW